MCGGKSVSYTHLDVYKRQDGRQCKGFNGVLYYIIFVQTGSVAAFAGTKAKDAYSWKNMDVCFHN